MQEIDFLILGAGWTSTFLIPQLQHHKATFAATTRDGRKVAGADTIKWAFDPDAADENHKGNDNATAEHKGKHKNQFSPLPLARTVLITFPLTGSGQSTTLVEGYTRAHGSKYPAPHFIQLGSTGIWQIPQDSVWSTRHSPYDTSNARAVAEDELLGLGGSVLNLAGLWGGRRDPRDWVGRVATTKEAVAAKSSVHLVHGVDVARAVFALSARWDAARGQRWMLTDGFVYDWWSLFVAWADAKAEGAVEAREPSQQAQWVFELMSEGQVQALPRSMETLGRCYDSREFWFVIRRHAIGFS